MKATPKSPTVAKFVNDLLGAENAREDAVATMHCVPKPIGCGQLISLDEFKTWGINTVREYRISGLCRACQIEFFGE